SELFDVALRQPERADELAPCFECRTRSRRQRDSFHRGRGGEARGLPTPGIGGDLHGLLLVHPVRDALEEAVVPAGREVEHVCEIRTGKARRRVAEVADVQALGSGELAVGVGCLIDVERKVAASLEEEARRRYG